MTNTLYAVHDWKQSQLPITKKIVWYSSLHRSSSHQPWSNWESSQWQRVWSSWPIRVWPLLVSAQPEVSVSQLQCIYLYSNLQLLIVVCGNSLRYSNVVDILFSSGFSSNAVRCWCKHTSPHLKFFQSASHFCPSVSLYLTCSASTSLHTACGVPSPSQWHHKMPWYKVLDPARLLYLSAPTSWR